MSVHPLRISIGQASILDSLLSSHYLFSGTLGSPATASVTIFTVLVFYVSIRLPQVIGSYFRGRETWEFQGKPGTAFQLGLLLLEWGSGVGSSPWVQGSSEAVLSHQLWPAYYHDPVSLSISVSLGVSSCCFVPSQHPLQTVLTAFTCLLASVHLYIWSLTYFIYNNLM